MVGGEVSPILSRHLGKNISDFNILQRMTLKRAFPTPVGVNRRRKTESFNLLMMAWDVILTNPSL